MSVKIYSDQSRLVNWTVRRKTDVTLTVNVTQASAAYNLSSTTFIAEFFDTNDLVTPIITLTQSAGLTNGGASGVLTIALTDTQIDILPNQYFWKLRTTAPTDYLWFNGIFQVNGYTWDGGSDYTVNVALTVANNEINLELISASTGGGSTTLQEAYDNGDGIITLSNGKPLQLLKSPTETPFFFDRDGNFTVNLLDPTAVILFGDLLGTYFIQSQTAIALGATGNISLTPVGNITLKSKTMTTVGGNLFALANPGAVTWPRLNADNTVSALSANNTLNALLPSQTGHSGEFLTTDGTNTSWAATSGGSLTVGTTVISSGVAGRILYNNSGVLGEYPVGTGVATFLGTPSWANFNSMITGTAPFWSLANGGTATGNNTLAFGTNTLAFTSTATTGTFATLSSSTLTSGTGFMVDIAGTAALTGSKGLYVKQSGANANNSQTTYAGYFENIRTGGGASNYAIYSTANGGAANYAAWLEGNVLVGTTSSTPTELLEIGGSSPAVKLIAANATGVSRFRFYETTTNSADFQFVGSNHASSTERNHMQFVNRTSTGAVSFWTNTTKAIEINSGQRITLTPAVTTQDGLYSSSSTLTTGNLFKVESTSTAINHTAGTSALINVTASGAYANSGRGEVGINVVMSGTGASSANYAIYAKSTGATTNYAIEVPDGLVRLGSSGNAANQVSIGGGVGSGVRLTVFGTSTQTNPIVDFRDNGNISKLELLGNGNARFTQSIQTDSWGSVVKITPGAHTGLTAATEFVSSDYLGATQTWADGTVATQRFAYFRAFTLNKTTTAATFTDTYRAYFEKSVAGSGVTLTNNWSVGMDGNLAVGGSQYLGGLGVLPTAFLHIAAGVTGNAQLRLVPGVAPSAPNDGDIYYINTNDRLMFFKNATASEILSGSAQTSEVVVSDATITTTFNGATVKILIKV